MSSPKLIREYSEITIRFEIDDAGLEWALSTAKNGINQYLAHRPIFTLTKAELKREYGPAEEEP